MQQRQNFEVNKYEFRFCFLLLGNLFLSPVKEGEEEMVEDDEEEGEEEEDDEDEEDEEEVEDGEVVV